MKLGSLLNFTIISSLTAGSALHTFGKPLNIAISVTTGSKSHVKYLFEISKHLVSRGHDITYLCSEMTADYSKGYNVSNVIVSNAKNEHNSIDKVPFTRKTSSEDPSGRIGKRILGIYTQSFSNYEKFYMNNKPDLIICDFTSPSCIDSAAKFSIPMIIGYQSLAYIEKMPYLNMVNTLGPTTIENASFLERFARGIKHPAKQLIDFYDLLTGLKRARKQFGIPSGIGLIKFTNMGLGIANTYIGFENPRSLPTNFHLIGPILPENHTPLSADLESFFNSHKKILYIAFGSLLKFKKDLSTNMLEHFQKLLNDGWIDGIVWGGMANTNMEEFPKSYTVENIEYSTESIISGTHKQFKLLKWAPQDAILNHPHTKLFMNHGGLDSIYESIQSGTPMIVIPYVGDQPRNAVLVKEHGIGDFIEWPLDGDTLINQKFINLLDPANIILKAKLDQFQRISKFSANRKLFAADLIETYAYTAKTCRSSETPKSFEIPCEVKPFLPLDKRMPSYKANLIDVYSVAMLMLLTTSGLLLLIITRFLTYLYKAYNKQKKD